jgi:CubicO group peptidase (beta-lactamase class C family)
MFSRPSPLTDAPTRSRRQGSAPREPIVALRRGSTLPALAAALHRRPLLPLLPALLLLAPLPPAGEIQAQGVTREQVARVDSIFQTWSDAAGPGAAVAVTRNGRIIYSQGYGSAQLEYRIPVTPTTIFHVASVSKQFTTFAVALLARDGLLSWDDPVHKHLPELPDLGRPFTLRHLANHTSGVRDQWELLIMAGWRMDDVITRDQIMQLMSRQRELNFEPGSEYLYSNMGYSLLAEVVERVSGQGFGEFLSERVFLPLGMHRTHVHSDHTRVVPGRAYSYAPAPGGWRNAVLSYANQGATSLFTTVEDLGRWMAEMEEPLVGDPELWAEMATPAALISGEASPYGLGLSVAPYRGLATQGHGGSDAGFRTQILHFPTERFGVVVFGNAATFNAGVTARQVAEVFLGDRMEPEPEREGLTPRPRVRVDAAVLDQLTGRYRLGAGRMVTVSRDGEELRALGLGEEVLALTPESDSTFWVPARGGRLTFLREPDGRLEGFSFVHPDGSQRTRRVEVEAFSPEELQAYVGTYYSPELDVVYRFVPTDEGSLAVHRPRQPAVELYPVDRTRFGGSGSGLNSLEFSFREDGMADGFQATGGRVRNLRFHRVEEWRP